MDTLTNFYVLHQIYNNCSIIDIILLVRSAFKQKIKFLHQKQPQLDSQESIFTEILQNSRFSTFYSYFLIQ